MGIYVINGAPCSGKDTFCTFVKNFMGEYCQIVSTVDLVKDVAKSLGWDGTKDLKNRKFLSDFKDLLTEWNDIPFKDVAHSYELFKEEMTSRGMEKGDYAFFVMCREPKEIKKFVERLGAKTVLVHRDEAENSETSCDSDKNVLQYDYDITINNNGTMRELAFEALYFIDDEDLFFPHWKGYEIGFNGEIQK